MRSSTRGNCRLWAGQRPKFSKVSLLLNLLYTMTVEKTFENFYPWKLLPIGGPEGGATLLYLSYSSFTDATRSLLVCAGVCERERGRERTRERRERARATGSVLCVCTIIFVAIQGFCAKET